MQAMIDQLRDPLSGPTRKVRKSLLASSIIGIGIAELGLVPNEIAAWGITFSESDQEIMLRILGGIILYFLFSFAIYLLTEYKSWILVLKSEAMSQEKNFVFEQSSPKEAYDEMAKEQSFSKIYNEGKFYLTTRIALEVLVPAILGLYAFYCIY